MPEDGGSSIRRFAEQVAAWVVARPQHAVLAIAVPLGLPLPRVFAGVFVVLLVLRRGMRDTAVYSILAGALIVGIAVVSQEPLDRAIASVAEALLPALLVGLLLQGTRSLTLTLQLTVILAAIVTVLFEVVVTDPIAFWQPATQQLIDLLRQSDLHEQADTWIADPAQPADLLTVMFVLNGWVSVSVFALLGYGLARSLGPETADFGRFQALNYGKVIAVAMALAAVLAWLAGFGPIQNVALVLFATFWLQGLAVVHWLYANGQLSAFVVIATYALIFTIVLTAFVMLALAVLGYTDAWFDYRRRVSNKLKD